jgi:hypothetical protein
MQNGVVMTKVKRFQDGGITITPQQSPAAPLPGLAGYGASSNTYPFQSDTGGSSGTSSGTSSGVNQTFNIQPTASTGASEAAPFKKGGAVKKMSKGKLVNSSNRGDGCCVKGKTKGRMV